MNTERFNRRFDIKEASRRLINPVKNVVEEAMGKLEDGVYDNFGRKRIALINNETNRLFLLDIASKRREARGDCGLFVEGIQLDNRGMPKNGLPAIQLPVDPNFVNKSSVFLLRGINPAEMLKLAREIGVAKIFELHIYFSYLTLLKKGVTSHI